MDLRESGLVVPEKHWYYRAKSAAIISDVGDFASRPIRILDIGAGSGFFARALVEELNAVANCVDTQYESEVEDGPITFTKLPAIQNPNVLLFIDVLEHVQKPISLLQEHLPSVRDEALVVISVPAFRFLWSSHDEFLGHYGRFEVADVVGWLKEAGFRFEVMRSHYLFSFIFPIVAVVRLFRRQIRSDLRKHNFLTNFVLGAVSKIDNKFVRNRLFGVSAYVVAKISRN